MAYTEGTATDQFDLLGKIKLFLEDNGWTIESYVADTSTYNSGATEGSANAKRLHASKSGRCLNFRSTSAAAIIPTYTGRRYGIGFSLGTAYDSSKGWANQTGVARILSSSLECPAFCWCNGAVSYRMFLWDSPFMLLIYLKHSSTFFSQMYFGTISPKYGTWVGGDIFLSSWTNSIQSTDASYTSHGASFLSSSEGFSSDGSIGMPFNGALNLSTSGIVSSGNTWPTRGTPDGGSASDSLVIPCLGQPMSHGSSSDKTHYYLANNAMDTLLQAMPSAFMSPICLLPIQPALIRSLATLRCSLLGELPHMKLTAGPTTLAEQIVTYADTEYILLPLGTPATYTSGNYINPLLAVEYEGS